MLRQVGQHGLRCTVVGLPGRSSSCRCTLFDHIVLSNAAARFSAHGAGCCTPCLQTGVLRAPPRVLAQASQGPSAAKSQPKARQLKNSAVYAPTQTKYPPLDLVQVGPGPLVRLSAALMV